jgi:hypothetical protein
MGEVIQFETKLFKPNQSNVRGCMGMLGKDLEVQEHKDFDSGDKSTRTQRAEMAGERPKLGARLVSLVQTRTSQGFELAASSELR